MSYVRKTMTLVEEIGYAVDQMKRDETNKLYQFDDIDIGTPLHRDVRNAIETDIWKQAPELKDKMPDDWCRHEDSVKVRFISSDEAKSVDMDFEVSNEDKVKCPPKFDRWDRVKIPEQDMTPLMKKWIEDRHIQSFKRQETQDMFDGIKKQLIAFMGKHASLNTAIKELPELEMYVPQPYLDRLAEETVKHKKVSPLENDDDDDEVKVDVEAITRAAIAHRITSSTK